MADRWEEDSEVWHLIDCLLVNSWPNLKELLDRLYDYRHGMEIQGQAIMFGILGKLCITYNKLKFEGQDPMECLRQALIAVHNDRRVQKMLGMAVDKSIDERVQKFQEENQ
tara:strand:+ start:10424 stop:10756 length:333 start_codon:yes stop_codon:yes gene_type:complete